MLSGEELKDWADIQVFLHRRLHQLDSQALRELLHLTGVDGSVVEQVHLGHHQHHRDVAALFLHLPLPSNHLGGYQ